MVAYLFAGQGAQFVGMGKDLYESFPQAKAIFDKADGALGFPLSRLCFEGPQQELTQTANCQPAILTFSIAAFEAFKLRVTSYPECCILKKYPIGIPKRHKSENYVRDELRVTKFMAGLSLGEYSALVASGAISFEDAVYLVRRRGEFMEEEARKIPGKMLSVIGLDLSTIKQICLQANTEIANLNCPGQIVISGGVKEIEEAQGLAKDRGAKMAMLLEVSGAFHSSFMKEAGLKLAKELEKIKISTPQHPVVSNVTAKPVNSADEIKDNLVKQVSSSVLWEDSMKFILSKGIMNFIEFGPGKVLKGLMRRISEKAEVVNIEKKEDILNLSK